MVNWVKNRENARPRPEPLGKVAVLVKGFGEAQSHLCSFSLSSVAEIPKLGSVMASGSF